MYIHWKQTYETGQPLMDAEHRLLVMLFRKLDVAIKTQQQPATISHIVLELRKCVEFHFVSEENVMRETGYPDIDEHRAQHAKLLLNLQTMINRLASHREYPDDVLDFLIGWLTEHIACHDQQVAEHVRSAQARPVAELIYDEFLRPGAASAANG